MPLNHSSQYSELTDEQFLLIGKLTLEFSNIEFLLGEVLSRLLVTPSFLGRTYLDRMNVIRIILKIRNAVDLHERRYGYSLISKDNCEEILNILKEIKDIRLLRNKFAHYCWSRWDDEKIFGTDFNGKQADHKKPNKDSKLIANQEIEEMYKKAYQIVDKLENVINNLPELKEEELKDKLDYN